MKTRKPTANAPETPASTTSFEVVREPGTGRSLQIIETVSGREPIVKDVLRDDTGAVIAIVAQDPSTE